MIASVTNQAKRVLREARRLAPFGAVGFCVAIAVDRAVWLVRRIAALDIANPGFWIACTCAALLVAGAIAGAVWGHLNPPKENDA